MTTTEVTVVRIYCSEQDGEHRRLLDILHERERVAGVTAFRGIAGFGGSGRVRETHLLDLSLDLPVVIEFFDRPERAEAIMEHLRPLVKPGHMIAWPARANLD